MEEQILITKICKSLELDKFDHIKHLIKKEKNIQENP